MLGEDLRFSKRGSIPFHLTGIHRIFTPGVNYNGPGRKLFHALLTLFLPASYLVLTLTNTNIYAPLRILFLTLRFIFFFPRGFFIFSKGKDFPTGFTLRYTLP